MEIREYTEYRAEEILPLYAAVGWTAYTDEPSVLERGFRSSLLVLAAYEPFFDDLDKISINLADDPSL